MAADAETGSERDRGEAEEAMDDAEVDGRDKADRRLRTVTV